LGWFAGGGRAKAERFTAAGFCSHGSREPRAAPRAAALRNRTAMSKALLPREQKNTPFLFRAACRA